MRDERTSPIKTEFTPRKEHQGYLGIVHGGIISTILDETMVKLAIEMKIPAVTAHMDIRLKKVLGVGEKITVHRSDSECSVRVARAKL